MIFLFNSFKSFHYYRVTLWLIICCNVLRCGDCGTVAADWQNIGQNNGTKKVSKRVVDGATAYLQDAPFVVQLIRNQQCFCTGSIIGPDTVLTAAHCTLHGVDAVVYGTTFQYNPMEGYFKSMPVRRVHRYPGYTGGVQPNDIAILELANYILPDPYAQAINLDDADTDCGSWVASYGFGRTKRIQVQHRMQVMETKVVNNCERTMKFDDYVVTQIDDKTVCNGDSGGPLINQNWRQIGVLSGTRQTGCVVGDINYFVKVATYLPFIKRYFETRHRKSPNNSGAIDTGDRFNRPSDASVIRPPAGLLSILPRRLECTLLRNALWRENWSLYGGEDVDRIRLLYSTLCFQDYPDS